MCLQCSHTFSSLVASWRLVFTPLKVRVMNFLKIIIIRSWWSFSVGNFLFLFCFVCENINISPILFCAQASNGKTFYCNLVTKMSLFKVTEDICILVPFKLSPEIAYNFSNRSTVIADVEISYSRTQDKVESLVPSDSIKYIL